MGFASPKPDGANGAQANGSRDSAAPRNGLKGRDIKEGGPAGTKGGAGEDDGGKIVKITDFRPTLPPPSNYDAKVERMSLPLPPGELPVSAGMPKDWEEPEEYSRPTKPSNSPEEVAEEEGMLEKMRQSGELAPPSKHCGPTPEGPVPNQEKDGAKGGEAGEGAPAEGRGQEKEAGAADASRGHSSLVLSDEQAEKLWAEYYRLQGLQKKGGD